MVLRIVTRGGYEDSRKIPDRLVHGDVWGLHVSSKTRVDDFRAVLFREIYRFNDGRSRSVMLDGHDFRTGSDSGDAYGIPFYRSDRSSYVRSMVGDRRKRVFVVILKIVTVRASSQIRTVFGFASGAVPHVREQIRMVVGHSRVDYRDDDGRIRPFVQRPRLRRVDILIAHSNRSVDRLSDVMESPEVRTVRIGGEVGTEGLVTVIGLYEFDLGILFQSCHQNLRTLSRRGFQDGKIPFGVGVYRLQSPIRRKFRRLGRSSRIPQVYFRFTKTDYHFVPGVRSNVLLRKFSRNRRWIGNLSGNRGTADRNVSVDLFFQTDLPLRSNEVVHGFSNRRRIGVRQAGRSPSLRNRRREQDRGRKECGYDFSSFYFKSHAVRKLRIVEKRYCRYLCYGKLLRKP